MLVIVTIDVVILSTVDLDKTRKEFQKRENMHTFSNNRLVSF